MTDVPMHARRLQFFDPVAGQRGSDKFYEIYWYAHPSGHHVVVKHWGRADTAGQFRKMVFNNEWEARQEVDDTLAGKLRRGYRITAVVDELLTLTFAQNQAGLSNWLEAKAGATTEAEYFTKQKYGVTMIIEEDEVTFA